MRNIEQCELMMLAAGVSHSHPDDRQSKPKAGFKDEMIIELAKTVLTLAIGAIWQYFFTPADQKKDSDKKDARYPGSSFGASF